MTTIIAVRNRNSVIMGSDSQATGHTGLTNMETPKVFTNGEYTIGVAGYINALQAVKFENLPAIPADLADPERFVKTVLIPAIKQMEIREEVEIGASQYVVSFRGHIFVLSALGYYLNAHYGVLSIGSGSMFAKGYLAGCVKTNGGYTQDDVYQALASAGVNDPYTSAPYFVTEVRR